MTLFEETIKAFLDKKAEEDIRFSINYGKEGKSIEECCKYIIGEVKKTGREGFADAEIYGMAIHYYDEDSLQVEEPGECRVVVNKEIQLTEEDKKRIEEEARRKMEADELERQKEKIRREKEKKEEVAKKRREKEQEEMYSLFQEGEL